MRKVLYIFGQLSDEDVNWISNNAIKENINTGTFIIKENEQVDKIYFLIRGRLSVTSKASEDKEIAKLKSGEVVGEMSFVDALPPSATVKAVEDSIVISLDRNLLIDKLEEDYEFASHFYKALAIFLSSRLRSTTSMLGYGKIIDKLKEKNYDDEVDPNVLENLSLAGDRFTRLIEAFS